MEFRHGFVATAVSCLKCSVLLLKAMINSGRKTHGIRTENEYDKMEKYLFVISSKLSTIIRNSANRAEIMYATTGKGNFDLEFSAFIVSLTCL